jgi:hypothetical protein
VNAIRRTPRKGSFEQVRCRQPGHLAQVAAMAHKRKADRALSDDARVGKLAKLGHVFSSVPRHKRWHRPSRDSSILLCSRRRPQSIEVFRARLPRLTHVVSTRSLSGDWDLDGSQARGSGGACAKRLCYGLAMSSPAASPGDGSSFINRWSVSRRFR